MDKNSFYYILDLDTGLESASNRYGNNLDLPIFKNGDVLDESPSLHLLGLNLTSDLSWKPYIKSVAKLVSAKFASLYRAQKFELVKSKTKQISSKLKDNSEILKVKSKLREIEDRSRRNNLRVDGLKESKNESWSDSEAKVLKLFEETLGLKDIKIERAHRTEIENNLSYNINAKNIVFSDNNSDNHTETLLESECYSIPESTQYLFHQIRDICVGGGISIYVHNYIDFIRRKDLNVNNTDCEALCVEIINKLAKNFIINAIYRSPAEEEEEEAEEAEEEEEEEEEKEEEEEEEAEEEEEEEEAEEEEEEEEEAAEEEEEKEEAEEAEEEEEKEEAEEAEEEEAEEEEEAAEEEEEEEEAEEEEEEEEEEAEEEEAAEEEEEKEAEEEMAMIIVYLF
ncbi:acidic leucine-rich nuclear phosphoprotein 32 family member A-like [Hydra vulgaris]|uniref:acidic leucine-rich nuclear phosphoprotein 32 family member A-like n=1 Tax=Hydra vulgaris TaxID=6087 RepID=UPI0032EA7AD3